MSIKTEIERITNERENCKTAIRDMGVDVPEDAKLEDLPDYIRQISPTPPETVDILVCSWAEIRERCQKLENGEVTDVEFCSLFTIGGALVGSLDDFIGVERNVLINNQVHKVKIIGVKHDTLSDDKTAAFTFEFSNLISDASGHSLATVWHDTATTAGSNYDYLNSSIRKALNGTGNAQQFKWCERQGTTFSTTYTGTVLSMLPTDLANVIQTAKKKVNIHNGSGWTLTEYTDKLFLLTTKEMGYSSQYSEDVPTYDYYEGHTEATDAIRIKKQVKSEDILTSSTTIPSGSGQLYTGSVSNWAGYQSSTEGYGGYFWLRSPGTGSGSGAWDVDDDGYCYVSYGVYGYAYGVAPAFCI